MEKASLASRRQRNVLTLSASTSIAHRHKFSKVEAFPSRYGGSGQYLHLGTRQSFP